ncbi:PorP/SprF family type IX secretion system membrane protein [Filimonas effusa]|uniref:Type IX secretion system membrane protein PorP/SprF n=1 Tax=Filimonas effusa TaxID=2508721 RepID=A0A4Q1D5K8_9BACT|nr:PorP/SprF family type IX secretion system membrane protein [Filimonas effusa]RXK82941.1 type IX secretion system membrane protein PorP/SprF [Filimonas effusa]
MKNKILYTILLVGSLVCARSSNAQSYFNNPISQYFQNRFLWNAAYAGANNYAHLYQLMNKSWIGFDGAPSLFMMTGDMRFGANSGAGLQVISDKSGLLRRTTGRLAYSYVVKMDEQQRLRLGIAASMYRERLDESAYINNQGQVDPNVKTFNDKGWTADGDFGAVYEYEQFSIGASATNLRKIFSKDENRLSDIQLFQFNAAYNFILEGDMSIQPLASFKRFSNNDNIFTGGAQFNYEKVFHASLLYQTTGSVQAGIGVPVKEMGEVNFFYGGNNRRGYGKQYEVALSIHIK